MVLKEFKDVKSLVLAKAKKQHENNLNYGGVYTENPKLSKAHGDSIKRDGKGNLWRVSNLEAEKRVVERMKLSLGSVNGVPAWIIFGFGYTKNMKR